MGEGRQAYQKGENNGNGNLSSLYAVGNVRMMKT